MTIYLLTGNGAGKTTSALGMAMRSLGHGHKVVMIQWMKSWKNTGEYKIQKLFGDRYRVYQFGRPGWVKLSDGEAKYGNHKFKAHNAENADREYALLGLRKAEEVVTIDRPNLLILDEICLAAGHGFLKVDEVLRLLNKVPKKIDVVLTGRHAPKKLEERVDCVNTMTPTKYPLELEAKKGIQY